jgi:nucleoside phosphorylase
MDRILICAAVEAELAPLRALALPSPLQLAAIGVGPVEAALGASQVLGASQALGAAQGPAPARSAGERLPAAAILVGTCGAFPGRGLEIGDAVLVVRSMLTASDAATGRSYIPAPAAVVSHADEALCASIVAAVALPRVGAATVAAITSDAEAAQKLPAVTGMDTEHMEAHAFLRAAELAQVPAACILGVANFVGPEAHAQWKAYAALASSAAAEALARWLSSS